MESHRQCINADYDAPSRAQGVVYKILVYAHYPTTPVRGSRAHGLKEWHAHYPTTPVRGSRAHGLKEWHAHYPTTPVRGFIDGFDMVSVSAAHHF